MEKIKYYETMAGLYARGIKYYSDQTWNITPKTRAKMLNLSMMQWNYWQGLADGRRTT